MYLIYEIVDEYDNYENPIPMMHPVGTVQTIEEAQTIALQYSNKQQYTESYHLPFYCGELRYMEIPELNISQKPPTFADTVQDSIAKYAAQIPESEPEL